MGLRETGRRLGGDREETGRRPGGDREETGCAGVRCKKLALDTERKYTTMLVQMDAGASFPSHRHAGAEECYVIHGDLHLGDTVLKSGDYQFAPAESDHGLQWTEDGCLLLIVASLEDELL